MLPPPLLGTSLSLALTTTLTSLVSRLYDVPQHTAMLTIPHAIVTGSHLPISVRPYYRAVLQRRDLRQEVDKLLLDNIIRSSTSPGHLLYSQEKT